MNVAVHDHLVQLTRSLEALKGVLAKGQAHAAQKKTDFAVYLQTRLVPDQFPLVKQVQVASDNAKGAAARLAGVEAPKMEDSEKTFEELVARLDKTIAFVRSVKPEQLEGWEKRKAMFPWLPGKYLEGRDYLLQYAVPNFYFHVAMAYAVLRSVGVDVGKNDYLGPQEWKQA